MEGLQDHSFGAYGAANGGPATGISPKTILHRHRMVNIFGVTSSILVPIALFAAVSATRSFSLRNSCPVLTLLILVCETLVVAAAAMYAYGALMRQRHGETNESKWYIFLTLTAALAYILGLVIGSYNYDANLSFYYSMEHLQDYSNVNPTKMTGAMLMDAGAVYFTPSSTVDVAQSIGFAGGKKTYCVAPISTGGSQPVVDFWAVGIGCCTTAGADFACGDVSNKNAHAGLRILKESQNEWYRVAIQKASATYAMQSKQPLFFTWVEDPLSEQANWFRDGLIVYVAGVIFYVCLQLFLVTLCCVFFAKVGY